MSLPETWLVAPTGLAVMVAVAVAQRQSIGAQRSMRRPGEILDFQLYQTLCGEADDLAQDVAVGCVVYSKLGGS